MAPKLISMTYQQTPSLSDPATNKEKGILFSELLIQSMPQWLACLELPQLSQGFFLVLVFHI